MKNSKALLKWCSDHWNTLVFVFTPIILLPLPLIDGTQVGTCAYCGLLMSTYWLSEALPLAVTAFLPVVLFPMLNLMSAKEVTHYYMEDATMMLIAGMHLFPFIRRKEH